MNASATDPIAIVGADATFACGDDLDSFAAACRSGTSGIGPIPPERWRASDYADSPAASAPQRGGFVDDEKLVFPWRRFRVPPLQAQRMHPMDRLLFRCITRAIDHAGYRGPREKDADKAALPRAGTAIFVGAMGPGVDPTNPHALAFRRHEVADALAAAPSFARLPPASREAVNRWLDDALAGPSQGDQGDVSGSASILAGRVANLLDLQGMHMGVDAEAASALAALDLAVTGLRAGDFDVAIVGAISQWLSPATVALYRAVAPGLILGEGGGALVLERLASARERGGHVLAVIDGVAVAASGRSRVPSVPSEVAMANAARKAGATGTTTRVFALATGHAAWDASEREALSATFPGAAITSTTGLTGHVASAAGMASLIAAALAVADDGEATAVTAWSLSGVSACARLRAAPAGEAHPGDRARHSLDAAIVAMGCWLPEAEDEAAFWRNLTACRGAIAPLPAAVFDPAPYYSADRAPAKIYTRIGACITRPLPDPGAPIPPKSLAKIDPNQLYALEVTRQALAQAPLDGIAAERVGVVMADMDFRASEIRPALWLAWLAFREPLRGALNDLSIPDAEAIVTEVGDTLRGGLTGRGPRREDDPIDEDTLVGMLGSAAAGRVAQTHDFRGPAMVVESACASSLAALWAGANMLAAGQCDAVVVGGVFSNLSPEYYQLNCSFGGLSPEGLFAFDANASGFALGEGAAAFVLMRESEAKSRGLAVRARVRGIGGSSDGKGKSILAPNEEGQALAIRSALAQASVPAESVRFVECHGAGTPVGDPIEVTSYAKTYGGRATPLGLTSVKTMVGHLCSGAGAASLVKCILALEHGVLPPSLGFSRPNERVPWGDGPFEVITEPRPWDTPGPRRAAVSSFGLGGSNFHAVIEGPPSRWPFVTADGGRAISIEREAYLEDHKLGEDCVIPGAVQCETLLEGVLATGAAADVRGLRDVAIELALRVYPGRPVPLRVELERNGDSDAVAAQVVSDFVNPQGRTLVTGRVHARGQVLLGTPPAAPTVDARVIAAIARGGADFGTCYAAADETILGPRLQSLRWIRVFANRELLGAIALQGHDRLFSDDPDPPMVANPFLLDGCFQAAGVLGTQVHRRASLPAGLAALHLYRRPRADETLYVHVRLGPVEPGPQREDGAVDFAHYDVDVFTADGTLVWRLERYRDYLLQALRPDQLATVDRVIDGVREDAALTSGPAGGA